MQSTMMDVPLSLNHLLDRAGTLFPRNDDRLAPARQVAAHAHLRRVPPAHPRASAAALQSLGLKKGDRVATLCWNHHAHLECYFGIPAAGGVMHTLNLRLSPDEIGWIAADAEDRFLVVDDILLPLYRQFARPAPLREGDRVPVLGRAGRRRTSPTTRRCSPAPTPDGFDYAAARRERPGGDVLHVGHHRPAEGRRLLAPLDGAAHAGRLPRRRTGACAATDVRAAGDADVPRQLLGHAVRRGDARREDGLPRPAPASRRPARPDAGRAADPRRSACRRSGSA